MFLFSTAKQVYGIYLNLLPLLPEQVPVALLLSEYLF